MGDGTTGPDGRDDSETRLTTEVPALDDRFPVPLRGVAVDGETRCTHWDSDVDVVALRFGCCETFYPCFQCHAETTTHEPEVWPRERFDEPAVLCGGCRSTMTAREYLACEDVCPHCGAAFNPGCRKHRDRYFED